jgi:hypothetical protein
LFVAGLTGVGIVFVAPKIGINSAVITALFLFVLNLLSTVRTVSGDFRFTLQQGALLNDLQLILSLLGSCLFALFIFIGPLLIGSIVEYRRRII